MVDPISLAISATSMVISGTVAWYTLLREGEIKMTKPTMVCFAIASEGREAIPKIYLRSLLYCTAKRGIVVENMFVELHQSEFSQTFSIWAYGNKEQVRGSGVYVGMEGVNYEHHFYANDDGFKFLPGDSVLEVFAFTVGRKRRVLLAKVHLSLTDQQASLLASQEAFIWFDWNPNSQSYIPQLLTRPKKSLDSSVLERLLFRTDGAD